LAFEPCLRDEEPNFMQLEVMGLVNSRTLVYFVASS